MACASRPRFRWRRVLTHIFALFLSNQDWCYSLSLQKQICETSVQSPFRRKILASSIGVVVGSTVIESDAQALGAPDDSGDDVQRSRSATSQEENPIVSRFGIKPATSEQPQIPLPTNFATGDEGEATTIQGLLYLKNPKSDRRPLPTDSITLTVTVATEASLKDPSSTLVQDNTLVAGAKLPMNRIRFPMRFQLSERNLLNGDATEWKKALETQDLMVQARVCSQETIGSGVSGLELLRTCQNNPTSDGLANDRSRIQAMGISKLLRFSDEQAIRAPVSLPLEYR